MCPKSREPQGPKTCLRLHRYVRDIIRSRRTMREFFYPPKSPLWCYRWTQQCVGVRSLVKIRRDPRRVLSTKLPFPWPFMPLHDMPCHAVPPGGHLQGHGVALHGVRQRSGRGIPVRSRHSQLPTSAWPNPPQPNPPQPNPTRPSCQADYSVVKTTRDFCRCSHFSIVV